VIAIPIVMMLIFGGVLFGSVQQKKADHKNRAPRHASQPTERP